MPLSKQTAVALLTSSSQSRLCAGRAAIPLTDNAGRAETPASKLQHLCQKIGGYTFRLIRFLVLTDRLDWHLPPSLGLIGIAHD